MAARSAGYEVVGSDLDPARTRRALELGVLDRVVPDAALIELDLLVVAAPVRATQALLRAYARRPPAARTIFDVASVKAPIVEAAVGLPNFVATHPIAGAEQSGPEAGRVDLFQGRSWIIDPSAAPPHRHAVIALIESVGARPVTVDAVQHDRIIALTSHLPQLLSVALAAQTAGLDDPMVKALCGPGIASMTRLATMSWEIWESIFSGNSANVAQEARALGTILLEFAAQLDAHRTDGLAEAFKTAGPAAERIAANLKGPTLR